LNRAKQVADGPGILALKGAQSVIAGGGVSSLLVNSTGHRGLSTGGTGDFLAGMIAAKVGMWKSDKRQGSPSDLDRLRQSVAEAVWLHGAAADHLGPGPLLVRELGASLTELLRKLNE
jgi:NAD(P)H-hydrate epimerase